MEPMIYASQGTSHERKRGGGSTLAAAAICLVFAVYDRESTGLRPFSLPLQWQEGVRTSDLCLALLKGL
jgi:hypothetical protein